MIINTLIKQGAVFTCLPFTLVLAGCSHHKASIASKLPGTVTGASKMFHKYAYMGGLIPKSWYETYQSGVSSWFSGVSNKGCEKIKSPESFLGRTSILADATMHNLVDRMEEDWENLDSNLYNELVQEEGAYRKRLDPRRLSLYAKIAYGDTNMQLQQAGYPGRRLPGYYHSYEFSLQTLRLATHPGRIFISEDKRDDKRDVVIAYRGTQDRYDWKANLQAARQVDMDFLGEQDGEIGRAHAGYYQEFKNSCDTLVTCLKQHAQEQKIRIEDLRVTVTGHSMGGALAIISALYLKTKVGIRDVVVATLGSPKVLNAAGSKICERLIGKNNILRFTNRDPVPYLISDYDWFYKHTGTEISMGFGSAPMHKIDDYCKMFARYWQG